MLRDIIEKTESVLATVVSGVCLLVSFALSLLDVAVPLWLDPAWIAVIVSGVPLLYSAVRKLIRNRGLAKISSALLISIAMIASIIIGDLFAAGEVAFIMAIGEILEDKTTDRAKKGLKTLISLTPATGRRIVSGEEEIVDAADICVGDVLRVLPGETIPVDGEIISGETSVDQSVVTGESLPVDMGVGDGVFCGTVNRFGTVDIKATKVGEDSSLQKLIRMVKDAENKKAPMQRVADRWASLLVPVALLLAVVAGVVKQDVVVAVTMLVVFCPCALVLATPTAIMAAIGQATKRGVIIKSGEALERMGKVDMVAFDKTGTLTYGRLEVSDVVPFVSGMDESALVSLAASVESKSEHPLGKAIVSCARSRDCRIVEPAAFRMTAGKGVDAEIQNHRFCCGSESYLAECGIDIPDSALQTLERFRREGKAAVLVATSKHVIGAIGLSDIVRSEAADVVDRLAAANTETALLTGDHRTTADRFAALVGIDTVKAQLLPEEKVSQITSWQQDGKVVCMVGDGINDAPALKAADVGIAMGTMGSDIAVEAADIALVRDDLSELPYLKRLSVATLRTIRFSIALSLLINFAAIVLSFFSLLNPTTGALVHNAGSVFVVLIAALLYDRKL